MNLQRNPSVHFSSPKGDEGLTFGISLAFHGRWLRRVPDRRSSGYNPGVQESVLDRQLRGWCQKVRKLS
jgi:hypothetical protein